MPNKKNNGPVKMSLGEFMGEQPASALPTRPKERGPDDDGSFRRRDYNDKRRESEVSKSEGDNNWRRGGGSDYSNNRREQDISRSDSDNNWRRGTGGASAGGGYNDRRGGSGGGYSSRDYDNRDGCRGGGYDNRNGYDRRGGGGAYNNDDYGKGGDSICFDRGRSGNSYNRGSDNGFGSSRFGGGGSNQPSSGVRPKLQLKSRTVPVVKEQKKEIVKEVVIKEEEETSAFPEEKPQCDNQSVAVETKMERKETNKEEIDSSGFQVVKGPEKKSNRKKNDGEEKKSKKTFEPEVVNPRAAALEAAPDVKRDSNNANRADSRDNNERYRDPPPVLNKRFEQLAVEERDKQKDVDSNRAPPPVTNSRFAAAAETDRNYSDRGNNESRNNNFGPPPTANSRFVAAAEADRDYNRDRSDRIDNRGPPPAVNSRFAAAVEADRDYNLNRERNDNRMDNRGPPPTANSRFAAAAEADRDYNSRNQGANKMDSRGPPPMAKSRFAAVAAEAEVEAGRDRSSNDRDDDSIRTANNRGPPPLANSRFAAAAADAERERSYDRDRDSGNGYTNDRRNGRYGETNGGGYNGRGYYNDDHRGRGGGGGRYDDEPTDRRTQQEPPKSSVADLLKPKARLMEENILKVPTKEQSDNFLKPSSKEKEAGKNTLEHPKSKLAQPATSKTTNVAQSSDDSKVLDEFASGSKLGEELKTWLGSLSAAPPPRVEKLVFHLLTTNEKSIPDVECEWAEPEKYGSALLSLIEEDVIKQMEVLFAIQKFCNTLGMPKINDEYLVQAMFRGMYKYDLADYETFMMWKEDESAEHQDGKLKAVIQTVDWFNWLEEDDDDDDDDEEE